MGDGSAALENYRYQKAAAKVDLSDLAVVRRHIDTANADEWPKPLLYALVDALSTTEAALASTRRDLEAHMDAAKVREAALAESRGRMHAYRAERDDLLEVIDDLTEQRKRAEREAVAAAALHPPREGAEAEIRKDLEYLKSVFEGNVAYPQNGPLASAVRRLTDHLGAP